MKTYSLYIHENKLTHQKYVGITCQKPEDRWGKNGNGYKHNDRFFSAITQYGWNNFYHTIIKNNLELQEALQLEKECIKSFNSIETGYNISSGGGYGFKKQVRCLTTNMIFDSVTDAATWANISPSNLSHCLNGDYNTAGKLNDIKLEWCFVIDYYNQPKKEKQKIKQEITDNFINQCIEDYVVNKISINQMAKKYGKSKSTISKILKDHDIEVLPGAQKIKKKIYKYDKNYQLIEVFDSCTKALNSIGLSDSNCSRLKKAYETGQLYRNYYWSLVPIESN